MLQNEFPPLNTQMKILFGFTALGAGEPTWQFHVSSYLSFDTGTTKHTQSRNNAVGREA
jgi:hypothetical protein